MSEPSRTVVWGWRALLAVALFTFLGSYGLLEPDEGRYAEIGREMAETGEWLVPHLNGFEHFQKPPLLYWATALSIRLLGAHEWAARLPSALAAFGTVLLTSWIGTQLFHRRAGFLAGVILLSCFGFFGMAHLLTPDMLLTFWITVAMACFIKFADCRSGRRWGFLFFVALGLGFLTKGPLALLVPLSAAIAWQVAVGRKEDAPALPWVSGLLLTLGIGLSWFVVLSLWRHDLFAYFWRYELVERFASSHHGRAQPAWFFVPVVLVATVPWCFLLPGLGAAAWRRMSARQLSLPAWLLLGWCLPPFLVLSLSGSKLPTYILPLIPAVALGLARYVTREEHTAPWVPRLAGVALLLWLAGIAVVPTLNDRLKQQASLRELLHKPDGPLIPREARVYAIEARCHGLEFYLRRLVSVTREQADLVLTPTPEQERRLLTNHRLDAEMLAPGAGEPATFVVVREARAKRDFPKDRWLEVNAAGDFRLLRSATERLEKASTKL